MEQKSIFRKSSLERLKSPEQLNDTLRLASPGIWMLLFAILLILGGVLIWSVTGSLTNRIKTVCVSSSGESCVFIREEDADAKNEGMVVFLDGKEYAVAELGSRPLRAGSFLSEYAMHIASFCEDDWVYPLILSETLPEGEYPAELITDTGAPISYLFG